MPIFRLRIPLQYQKITAVSPEALKFWVNSSGYKGVVPISMTPLLFHLDFLEEEMNNPYNWDDKEYKISCGVIDVIAIDVEHAMEIFECFFYVGGESFADAKGKLLGNIGGRDTGRPNYRKLIHEVHCLPAGMNCRYGDMMTTKYIATKIFVTPPENPVNIEMAVPHDLAARGENWVIM